MNIKTLCSALSETRRKIHALETEDAAIKKQIMEMIDAGDVSTEQEVLLLDTLKSTGEASVYCDNGRYVNFTYDFTVKSKVNIEQLSKMVTDDVFKSMLSVTQKQVVDIAGRAVLDRCLESKVSTKKVLSISCK